MSGDVQPRKRKDKRRKKEDPVLGSVHEPVASHKSKKNQSDDLKAFDLPDQGEKIHIHSEHGVGGNICVKIIFFCLFGLLLGAVGLIYLKSQGSTDVDLPTIEESRFAEYFTGWLDDGADDHEHEVLENNEGHDENDDHDEDHEEHEDQEDQEEHENHDEDDDTDNDEHETENHSSELDPIYKFFGLQDEPDEVEDNIKAEEVAENESGVTHDVNEGEEDEDEESEEDDEGDDDVDDGDEDDNDNGEDEEEKAAKEDSEEEEEEDDDEEDDNKKDNVEDENEEDLSGEEEGEEDKDSGVDLEKHYNAHNENNEDEDEDDDDLSQMDEEEESRFTSNTGKRLENKEISEQSLNDDDEDDLDDSETLEKEINRKKHVTEDDRRNDRGGVEGEKEEEKEEEEGKQNDEDEDSDERKNLKYKDDDDLGFEEIEISEEDLQTEDLHNLKVHSKDEKPSHFLKEERRKSLVEEHEEGLKTKDEFETEEEEETEGINTRGVALKLIVGVALIIVAHLVLVKKWKSMNNVSSDENVSTIKETVSEKKKIENLQSGVEPVISRRQTLVPENISLNEGFEGGIEEEEEEEEEEAEEEIDEEEEEEGEDEDEEEENIEDNEIYSEEECEEEEFKKSKSDIWETLEKPTWDIRRSENEEDDYEEELEEENEEEDVEEIDDEQQLEKDEEYEEEDEDYEEDVDNPDEEDVVKQKTVSTVPDIRQEEVKEEEAPTPPPRTRPGRGGNQDVDEDFTFSEETNLIEETSQDSSKAGDEINNNSGPEEQKTTEKKVGDEDEWAFRQEFDFADEQFENNPKAALDVYEKIISKKPTVIKALIGRAKVLDHLAEKQKSNAYLKQAINAYKTILFDHGHRLEGSTYVQLAERCIERMRFAGNFVSAIDVHKALILKYPDTPKYRNMLAVTYLMLNKIPQARVLLNETLSLWPDNGFALVHYGFILKTSDNNMEEGAQKLMAGIQTREEGVIDGMFFFHLGDALNRLGREKEAMKWYELGVKEGLFLSKYQRSLYNVNRLKGQPWWTKEETTYQDFFKKLEENWREIRREGLELLNSKGVNLFKDEAENLKDTGNWKQLDLYFRGRKQANCNKAPITCSLVSSFKPASTCTRGQIKFSVMLPNTHVWPHCGPTNCRLRSHLGLVVPKKTFIRVAEETKSWEEGKFIIFDDSFEHEVWHNGTGLRLVLIVDVWHPELTNNERRYLSPI